MHQKWGHKKFTRNEPDALKNATKMNKNELISNYPSPNYFRKNTG